MCCIKKRRPLKRYRKKLFIYFSLCSLCTLSRCRLSIFNWRSCVYFFIDASNLPQDSPTRCFGQAVHEAALVSGPHTSASLYLWSLQPLKPVNLCSLRPPDHILEHWSPAEQLQRWVSAPECRDTTWYVVFPFVATVVCLWNHVIVVISFGKLHLKLQKLSLSYILTTNELHGCYSKS